MAMEFVEQSKVLAEEREKQFDFIIAVSVDELYTTFEGIKAAFILVINWAFSISTPNEKFIAAATKAYWNLWRSCELVVQIGCCGR